MDKNTLKMMLLMAVVVFGFMLINKPKPRQADASADNKSSELVAETRIDSIRPDEAIIIYAADFLRQAGTPAADEAGNTVYAYNTPDVRLTLDNGVIAGEVSIDDKTISYDDVVASQFPDTFTLEQKSRAASALRQALGDASRYKSFARHRVAPEEADATPLKLENNVMTLEFSRKGGIISRATLSGKDKEHDYYTYFLPRPTPKRSTPCLW